MKISSWLISPLKTVHIGMKKAKKIIFKSTKKSQVILNLPEGSITGIFVYNLFMKNNSLEAFYFKKEKKNIKLSFTRFSMF
jgi:hypothetical protein